MGEQAGIGQLLADRDEFGGEAAEALVLGELGFDGGSVGGWQGAGGAFAVDMADQQEIGAMAVFALLVAATGRGAALHEAMDEGAGAHIADGGELGEDVVAALFEGGDGGGSGHEASLL